MGQSMGVTATGILLLRMVDPENKSGAFESFAYKQLFCFVKRDRNSFSNLKGSCCSSGWKNLTRNYDPEPAIASKQKYEQKAYHLEFQVYSYDYAP